MADSSRVTIRLPTALLQRLTARLRPGATVSDTVRHALEAYLSDTVSDSTSDASDTAPPLASDRMSDSLALWMQQVSRQLGEVSDSVRHLASDTRPTRRQGKRPTVSDKPSWQALEPTEKRGLGALCERNHDWRGTGQSMRQKSNNACLACSAEKLRAARAKQRGE